VRSTATRATVTPPTAKLARHVTHQLKPIRHPSSGTRHWSQTLESDTGVRHAGTYTKEPDRKLFLAVPPCFWVIGDHNAESGLQHALDLDLGEGHSPLLSSWFAKISRSHFTWSRNALRACASRTSTNSHGWLSPDAGRACAGGKIRRSTLSGNRGAGGARRGRNRSHLPGAVCQVRHDSATRQLRTPLSE
jgi:hypothetical protein